jgi:putative transposase
VSGDVRVSGGGVDDVGLQVAWCLGYCRPVLVGGVAGRLREPIDAEAAEDERRIAGCAVMPDRRHLVVRTRPQDSPSYVANQFPGATSGSLRREFEQLRSRLPTLWSRSYFVAGGGAVRAAQVQRHIDTQYERPWHQERAK